MEGRSPLVMINPGHTETQRNEQRGVALLAKGLFAGFRNPAAHEPRLHWSVSEHDALDVWGTLSLVRRRLDIAALLADSYAHPHQLPSVSSTRALVPPTHLGGAPRYLRAVPPTPWLRGSARSPCCFEVHSQRETT